MGKPAAYLLQQFPRDTGWPPPRDAQVADRMQTALAFFHKHLAGWIKVRTRRRSSG
jgi:hypothetical protein